MFQQNLGGSDALSHLKNTDLSLFCPNCDPWTSSSNITRDLLSQTLYLKDPHVTGLHIKV